MIHLHERLSEFSYGYGATREAEALLRAVGLQTTPFLPSLLHEKQVGFDVAFSGPGVPVMFQFKLGHELTRYRRASPAEAIPQLQRPFWRFYVDVDEHQFLFLLEYEEKGSEVYYVAPRFSSWAAYASAFEEEEVLERSLSITPSELRRGASSSRGKHRIVYDREVRYVLSDPVLVEEVRPRAFVERVEKRARDPDSSLDRMLQELAGLAEYDQTVARLPAARRDEILGRARTVPDGLAAVIGLEAWLQGAQVLFVTSAQSEAQKSAD